MPKPKKKLTRAERKKAVARIVKLLVASTAPRQARAVTA